MVVHVKLYHLTPRHLAERMPTLITQVINEHDGPDQVLC